jgi:hypothetical protein
MGAMSTAAFDVPTRPDDADSMSLGDEPGSASTPRILTDEPLSDLGSGSQPPHHRYYRVDLVSLILRPPIIFLGLTATGYALVRGWPERQGPSRGLESYLAWLTTSTDQWRSLGQALGLSAELAAAALAIGIGLALVLGGLARWRRLRSGTGVVGVAIMSLTAPVIGLMAYYWLILRFDVGLRTGAVSVFDDWGRGVDRLVLPAAVVGLTLAPSLASMMVRPRANESRAWIALASPLASRPPAETLGPGPNRVVGFPAGLLVAGLAVVELLFNRPGLFSRLVTAVADGDAPIALGALSLMALAAAAMSLVIDLVGLIGPTGPARFGPAEPPPRPTARELRFGAGLLLVMAAVGAGGWVLGRHPAPDPGSALGAPLLAGLLGSDGAGRDLLALTTSGLGRAMVAAGGPSLVATIGAWGLARLALRWPRIGMVVPGAAVDAVWWPLGVLLMFASQAFVTGDGLLHPAVLALTALVLLPTGLRLVHRIGVVGPGGLAAAAGAWLLLAPFALIAHLLAAFAGFDGAADSLGQELAASVATLGRSQWPSVWPAVGLGLLLVGCYNFGSALVAVAWHQNRRTLDGGGAWGLTMTAEHDETPWYGDEAETGGQLRESTASEPGSEPTEIRDGFGLPRTGQAGPEPDHEPGVPATGQPAVLPADSSGIEPGVPATGQPAVAPADGSGIEPGVPATGQPAVLPADSSGIEPGVPATGQPAVAPADGSGIEPEAMPITAVAAAKADRGRTGRIVLADEASGGEALSPNYDLQPGLPPPALDATLRLPVVRVKRAEAPDPEGFDPSVEKDGA